MNYSLMRYKDETNYIEFDTLIESKGVTKQIGETNKKIECIIDENFETIIKIIKNIVIDLINEYKEGITTEDLINKLKSTLKDFKNIKKATADSYLKYDVFKINPKKEINKYIPTENEKREKLENFLKLEDLLNSEISIFLEEVLKRIPHLEDKVKLEEMENIFINSFVYLYINGNDSYLNGAINNIASFDEEKKELKQKMGKKIDRPYSDINFVIKGLQEGHNVEIDINNKTNSEILLEIIEKTDYKNEIDFENEIISFFSGPLNEEVAKKLIDMGFANIIDWNIEIFESLSDDILEKTLIKKINNFYYEYKNKINNIINSSLIDDELKNLENEGFKIGRELINVLIKLDRIDIIEQHLADFGLRSKNDLNQLIEEYKSLY